MGAHTPGPWKVYPDEQNRDHQLIIAEGGIDVASVRPWMTHFEANSALIAAAPELLAELQNIANADPAGWDDPSDFRAWAQNRARHALAKAAVIKGAK